MDEYKYLLLFSGWVCGDLLGLSGLRPLLLDKQDGLKSMCFTVLHFTDAPVAPMMDAAVESITLYRCKWKVLDLTDANAKYSALQIETAILAT